MRDVVRLSATVRLLHDALVRLGKAKNALPRGGGWHYVDDDTLVCLVEAYKDLEWYEQQLGDALGIFSKLRKPIILVMAQLAQGGECDA